MLQVLKLEMSELPTSNNAGLGAAMAAQVMIGFWLRLRVIFASGVVDSLNYCIWVFISSSSECGCH